MSNSNYLTMKRKYLIYVPNYLKISIYPILAFTILPSPREPIGESIIVAHSRRSVLARNILGGAAISRPWSALNFGFRNNRRRPRSLYPREQPRVYFKPLSGLAKAAVVRLLTSQTLRHEAEEGPSSERAIGKSNNLTSIGRKWCSNIWIRNAIHGEVDNGAAGPPIVPSSPSSPTGHCTASWNVAR